MFSAEQQTQVAACTVLSCSTQSLLCEGKWKCRVYSVYLENMRGHLSHMALDADVTLRVKKKRSKEKKTAVDGFVC